MKLVWPSLDCLPSYRAALQQGGSPGNLRGRAAAADVASPQVIGTNGGVLVERFVKPAQYGAKLGRRYRIALA